MCPSLVQGGLRTSSITVSCGNGLTELTEKISCRCSINCGRKASTSKEMVLHSLCKGQSCGIISSYYWSILVSEIDGSRVSWTQMGNLNDFTSTTIDGPDLVIRRKMSTTNASLANDKRYKVCVTVEVDERSQLRAEYYFLTNSPPRVKRRGCQVTPSHGTATITEFTFYCEDFVDEDMPLRFQFAYVSNLGTLMVLQNSESNTLTTTLPLGEKERLYMVHLIVQIFDSQGDSVTETLKVKVRREPIIT